MASHLVWQAVRFLLACHDLLRHIATPSTDSAALRNKSPTLTSPSSSFAKLSCAEHFPKHQDLKNRENLPPRRNTSFLPSIGSPHLMLRPCPLIRMELSRDCCCDPYGPSSTSLSFQLWTPSPTILAGRARHGQELTHPLTSIAIRTKLISSTQHPSVRLAMPSHQVVDPACVIGIGRWVHNLFQVDTLAPSSMASLKGRRIL